MSLKIDNAIEEIERALAGNKPKYANDIYLKNAIRYLQEIKSPSFSDDQQIVLEWLKSIGKEMPIYRMADQMKWYIDYASTGKELSHALAALSEKEEFQVLTAFAQWGLKQEEE